MRYGITGVFNEREHGKTTYMVKHTVSEVNSGVNYDEAYSNIHIGPKVDPKTGFHYGHPKIHFVNYEQMMALKLKTQNGVPRALLALDQVPNYIDARASNTKLNIDFSKFVRESRQHGLDMIYTTWMRSEVDKRLRPFTDLIIAAKRIPPVGPFVRFEYRRTVRETGRILPTVSIPLRMAKPVWAYFDSAELIDDPTIPGKER